MPVVSARHAIKLFPRGYDSLLICLTHVGLGAKIGSERMDKSLAQPELPSLTKLTLLNVQKPDGKATRAF